jgi:hypothetical protein
MADEIKAGDAVCDLMSDRFAMNLAGGNLTSPMGRGRFAQQTG